MEATDDLVHRFTAGDETAVREVVRRHSGAITTVARSMVRSDDLVAEVVQQTFVKAWRGAATFEPSRPLAPWLYSIARRTAIDVLRREGRHVPEELDDNTAAPTTMTFERTWEIHEVRTALDGLPDEERVVMKLAFLEGLTHDQIAARLDIPAGTVKSRTNRAKKKLLSALGHLHPGANQPAESDVQGVESP